jgi:hypothetical protein
MVLLSNRTGIAPMIHDVLTAWAWLGATEIARAVGCKRGNVYKALKVRRLRVPDRLHLPR